MKAILMYHSIDPSGSIVSVHPARFREHLEILSEFGVRVLSLADLLDPGCAAGVAITFDDGFENLASVAWPLLRERGFTATVFIASDWVGKDNAWDLDDGRIPRLPLLDWTALRTLAGEGLEIGSHSRTHPRLTKLDTAALADELESSRDAIAAESGRVPTTFAYPYGDQDPRVALAVEQAGYQCALTTELRVLSEREISRFTLPRLDAYYLAKPGIMERWGTASFRRYMVFRHAARRVRTLFPRTGPRR